MFEELIKMYELAVWDKRGRQYLPIFEDGEIVRYAYASEAIDHWNDALQPV